MQLTNQPACPRLSLKADWTLKLCDVRVCQAAIMYSQEDRLQYVRMLLEAGSEMNHRDEANHNSMLNLLIKSKRLGHKVRAACVRVWSVWFRLELFGSLKSFFIKIFAVNCRLPGMSVICNLTLC